MHKNKPEILKCIKIHGPILPRQILKFVDNNLLFASAMLSELVREGEIHLTNAKIGGSPLYYIKGQEPRLQNLYQHLSTPLKKAYDLLKTKKILRDKECEPWQRVALRELKDFAIKLDVSFNEINEVFWKWYLINDEEAKEIIKGILTKGKPPEKWIKPERAPVKKDILKKMPLKKIFKTKDDFYLKVKDYFGKNNIKILFENVVKKNKEADFIAEVPSQLGLLKFYIKAKNKNKINNNDLRLAYHHGQSKKLPAIFLSTGELTSNAKILLNKELKGLVFKKINS